VRLKRLFSKRGYQMFQELSRESSTNLGELPNLLVEFAYRRKKSFLKFIEGKRGAR